MPGIMIGPNGESQRRPEDQKTVEQLEQDALDGIDQASSALAREHLSEGS